MNKLIALLIALFSCPFAWAGDGSTPLIVFRNGSASSTEIIYTNSSNIQSPDVAYDFTPTDGDNDPRHYTNTGSTYTYTPPGAPPPPSHPNMMDVKAFEVQIWADTNPVMTNAVKFMVAQNFPVMESNATSLVNLQAGWSGAVAAFGSSWLTSDVQTEIVSVALANNIQLVP